MLLLFYNIIIKNIILFDILNSIILFSFFCNIVLCKFTHQYFIILLNNTPLYNFLRNKITHRTLSIYNKFAN